MRFLVQVGQQQMPFSAVRDLFTAMEEAGFAGGYLYDHFLPISPPDDAPCLEAWSCLIGTRDQLEERVAAFREVGVRDVVLMAGRPLKRAALERFAAEVMPHFT